MTVSRRSFFKLTARASTAVAAFVALPALPSIASAQAVQGVALPFWTVGPFPGEDWDVVHPIRAATAKDAIALVAEDQCLDQELDGHLISSLEATRVPSWDALSGDPSPCDWIRAGYETNCERCGYPSGDTSIVGDQAVCVDCTKLSDHYSDDLEYFNEQATDLLLNEPELEAALRLLPMLAPSAGIWPLVGEDQGLLEMNDGKTLSITAVGKAALNAFDDPEFQKYVGAQQLTYA